MSTIDYQRDDHASWIESDDDLIGNNSPIDRTQPPGGGPDDGEDL